MPHASVQEMTKVDILNCMGVGMAVLAVAVLLLGLWPAPLVQTMESSVQHLLQQLSISKIPAA